jgi:hypothetical protein
MSTSTTVVCDQCGAARPAWRVEILAGRDDPISPGRTWLDADLCAECAKPIWEQLSALDVGPAMRVTPTEDARPSPRDPLWVRFLDWIFRV